MAQLLENKEVRQTEVERTFKAPKMTDEDTGNAFFEDFDFDFINSTITSSSEEMKSSLAACL